MKRGIKNAKWSQGKSRITKATDKTKNKIATKLKAENPPTNLLKSQKGKK